MKTLVEVIAENNACQEAVDWIAGGTIQQSWNRCDRADWLFWVASASGVDRKLVIRAACVRANMLNTDSVVQSAIDVVYDWTEGNATEHDCRLAYDSINPMRCGDKPEIDIAANLMQAVLLPPDQTRSAICVYWPDEPPEIIEAVRAIMPEQLLVSTLDAQ